MLTLEYKRSKILNELLTVIVDKIPLSKEIQSLEITWVEMGEYAGDLPTPNIKLLVVNKEC